MKLMRALLWIFLCLLVPLARAAADDVRQLRLPVHDLVYDPFSRMIYASVAGSAGRMGDSITAIDPVAGTIGASTFVGSEPDRLALSDDGQYLYAALDGEGAVRQVALATQTAGPVWPLQGDPFAGYFIKDLAVLPGEPESLAVSWQNSFVAIYDAGVRRPLTTTFREPGDNIIQASASAARLYIYPQGTSEYGFRRLLIDPTGISVSDVTRDLVLGSSTDFRYDGGLIYTTIGQAIDPEARRLIGTFPGVPAGALVLPDAAADRVFFLTGSGPVRTLQAYDARSFLPLGSLAIPGVFGQAGSLIRWGVDGIAFHTSLGQLFLIRTALVPTGQLSLSFAPATVMGGRELAGWVTLPEPAPPGGTVVQLSSSSPTVVVPASVIVPAGAVTAPFPVTTSPTALNVSAGIAAAAGGGEGEGRLTVLAPFLAGTSVSAGGPDAGTAPEGAITLSGPAAAGGARFTLSSSDPALVDVPAAVTVPAGAAQVRFPLTIHDLPDPVSSSVAITAVGLGDSQSTTLALDSLSVASLTVTPGSVTGGSPVTVTVTLSRPAPEGGAFVKLSAGDGAPFTLPDSVEVAAGARSAAFRLTTQPVPLDGSWTIFAYSGVGGRRARLTVLAPVLGSLVLDPPRIVGGQPASAAVTLGSAAPAGGLSLALCSADPAVAAVPASVTIPEGQTRALFPIATSAVTAARSVAITAVASQVTQTAALTVLPPSQP